MFGYVLFMSFWLVTTPGSALEWLTAPERLVGSVARLFYTEETVKWQHILRLKIETVPFKGNGIVCYFNITSRPNVAVMNITSFRRLDKNLIVLSWYNEMAHGYNRQTEIAIISSNNCTRNDLNLIVENAIVLPSADNLDIFFQDSSDLCSVNQNNNDTRSIYRCWYSYFTQDISNTPIASVVMKFNVNLDWSSMRIDRLPSKDFVVRGFQGELYKVLKMDHSNGKFKELMSLKSPNRTLQMASRGLTFCWVDNSGYDKNISCNQFNNRNKLVYSTTASFHEPIIIKYVQSDYEGQISCLVVKAHCTDREDCWTFTRKNFYRKGNRSTKETDVINCKSKNRNNFVFFGFLNNTSSVSHTVICTRSGDVLGSE
ncbi:uncharacterized protein LOC131666742 [Phymastichus coffea]|uniref:uncharacterized protein LOC131666742 n=1 Tax=Phymastichus coffea TaxID=108790 RepID=UPI00273CAD4A|nr:uncharacterized protein LOC131666742 [Phymastichus coffea]XP_058795606.1 uncharacterized protein LOC131666742 [Phymastichus coffea]